MRNMKEPQILAFQTTKHHRQILHQQIDQNMINRLQIDLNPSLNYRSVFRGLYRDQLQKTIQQQQVKKQSIKQQQQQQKLLYTNGIKQEKPNHQHHMRTSMLGQYGQRFVDYDQQLNIKKQDHVQRNYDGGQAFYKAADQHVKRRRVQSLITGQTLANQIYNKEFLKQKQNYFKQVQNQALREHKNLIAAQQKQKVLKQKLGLQCLRKSIIQQIETKSQCRQQKSTTYSVPLARHNPITNPIQYHIENPYILKQIQNRNRSIHM